MEQHLDTIFKALISLGVGLVIYLLKDFKSSMNKVADGLNKTNLSLQTLIANDNHKATEIASLRLAIAKNEQVISEVRQELQDHIKETAIRLSLLEQKQ